MHFDRRLRARLSLATLAVTIGWLAFSAPDSAAVELEDGHLVCGRDIQVKMEIAPTPPRGLQVAEPTRGKKAANIVLNAGPGLTARPAALAAWNRAVATWASLLEDNVTVVIDGDFASLPAGVLGATSPRGFLADYATVRNQVVADAAADESYVTTLPGLAQFSLTVPPGFSWTGNVSSAKAALKALGFDMSFDDANPDATMTFSTGFASSFDYDDTDGIDPGKFDFEAIVVHELGHALGYSSQVDYADFVRSQGGVDVLTPTTLDLFRMLPGQGASNFSTAARLNTTGDIQPVQAWWDGTQDLLMSTGSSLGDGRQASHWKADELTGNFIGIMDPTLAPGQHEELTDNDLRAFSVIGWDITIGSITDCNDNGIEDADDISGGTSQDCNSNGIPDECDIAGATSNDVNGNGVPDECEADCNTNGVPDDWDISQGTSEDCNTNGVPDECDIASATSNDLNTNGIPDECEPTGIDTPEIRGYDVRAWPNPFNPRSTVFFDMPEAGAMSLTIFDVTGRKVATLAEGHRDAGRHEVIWSGQANDGSRVASGVYYVVFQAGDHHQRMKLTLLK